MLTPEVRELLIKLETDIIIAQKNSDFSFVENLLWDEFQEIDSRGGISNKAEVTRAISKAQLYDYKVEKFAVSAVNDACAIVTYIATTKRLLDGQERISHSRRSSTWVQRDGSWRMIFHQGTPLTAA
jgi:glyoxylase I family protein